MTVPARLKKFTKPIPVLDDGHVMLIDVMGNDHDIISAARVSFFGHADENTDEENRHLLRYLMRGRHTTPFEMCELKIRVRVPMDAWRQWIRHRTANVNESSTRYAPAIDSAQKVAFWRSQSKDNKQGSSGTVTEWPEGKSHGDFPMRLPQLTPEDAADYLTQREALAQSFAREVYEERLEFGVAKEQARKDLPLSTYTEAYWKIDLHNLFHFLGLRLDAHAQAEIRQYAEAIAEIVKVWVPWAWEAFEDYRLEGMMLTRFDVAGLKAMLERAADQRVAPTRREGIKDIRAEILAGAGLDKKSRERKELIAKLDILLPIPPSKSLTAAVRG